PRETVGVGAGEPREDGSARGPLPGRSTPLSLAWPRHADCYDRYLTLRRLSEDERAEWKAAVAWFVQKLAFRCGRPLVLKSPGHTGRIRLLLELFPDARFVHIHRNPYAVFQSARHTVLKASPWWALQRSDH